MHEHLFVFPRRRRPHRLEHFLRRNSRSVTAASAGRIRSREAEDVPESCRRALWPPARSGPAQCMTAAEGARRCSSTCRGGCSSSTPSSSCPGVPCRRTWPGAARALAGCGACRPVAVMVSVGRSWVNPNGGTYHILFFSFFSAAAKKGDGIAMRTKGSIDDCVDGTSRLCPPANSARPSSGMPSGAHTLEPHQLSWHPQGHRGTYPSHPPCHNTFTALKQRSQYNFYGSNG